MNGGGNTDLDRRLSAAITGADPDLVRRLDRDPGSYLELVRLTAEADARVGRMLADAVSAARRAGHTWEAIGSALGMTRQAAQQRFGGPSGANEDAAPGFGLLTIDSVEDEDPARVCRVMFTD